MSAQRALAIGASAIVACAVLRRGLVVVTVRGGSMRPTYFEGDRVLGLRWRLLRRGTMIVFTPPAPARGAGPRYRVKRLVAVAGDPTPGGIAGHPLGSPVPSGADALG